MASSIMPAFSLALSTLLIILYCSPTVLSVARADLALDCCLKVSSKTIPKHILLTYQKQMRGNGCSLDAVVFITKKGRHLCAPPAGDEPWVKETINFLDVRLKKCKESKFQAKHCHPLKNLSV